MKIITKADATHQGLKRYFTGNPCRKGHVSERDIRGKCLSCSKIVNERRKKDKNKQAKEWRDKNKDKCKENSKNDRLKHKLYFKEYQENRKKNTTEAEAEKRKIAAKKYAYKNKEAKKDYARAYYEKNKDKIARKRHEDKLIVESYKNNELVKVGVIGKIIINLKGIFKQVD